MSTEANTFTEQTVPKGGTQTISVTAPADATVSVTETPAHTQTTTLHIVECVPGHEPRAGDPHYAIFNQTRARLKKMGLLKCWVANGDCAGQIELHHDKVEFSLQNGVDLTRFEEAFPEFTGKTDDEFKAWIEGEGNLMPLCKTHHTGYLGVHVIPYPLWLPQKFWKAGVIAPAHIVTLAQQAAQGASALQQQIVSTGQSASTSSG